MKLIKVFMRFFFYLLYHPLAWAYDLVALTVSLGRWHNWVETALEFIQGAPILEIGFGPGHLQCTLHERGINSFGLDESFQMATHASRRLTRHGAEPRLTRGIAQQLPFPGLIFATIVATFPSEYIIDPNTLAEIFRVLRPDGKLIVLASAAFGGKNFRERAAAWLFRVTGQAVDKTDLVEKIAAPFKAAGFDPTLTERETRHSTLFFIVARKQVALEA